MKDFSGYHFAETAKIITNEIPGLNSQALLETQKEIEGNIVSYPINFPIAIRRAKGATIEDVDGNLFLDFFSFAGVVNLGHCNEEIMRFASAQQEQLIHALDFPTENKVHAIQNILLSLPSNLREKYKVSFVGPTGADAIEAAVKLAKITTGRDTLVAFSGSYHGMTSGALSLTSDVRFRTNVRSLVPNIHYVPYSYCYRCIFKLKPENCDFDCVDYLRNILENSHSGVPKPAAILLEPLQGEGGNIVPKPGYLLEIVKLAHKHGVLVIFDEVQAGFFRSGQFLSFMDSDAVPDIITMSKGLGGVGYPIAAIVYKKEIEGWRSGDHVGTFRGNQVSLAAANGAFEFVRKHNVEEHVKDMSKLLFEGLADLANDNPFIGEIRGKGLMIGIELVISKDTKEPFPDLAKNLRINAFQRGLMFELGGHFGNVVRLLPPLIVTPKIIASALNILKDALKASVNKLANVS